MKICATSDFHGFLPATIDIPECDLLLIPGDLCPVRNHDLYYQKRWLEDNFDSWLCALQQRPIGPKKIIGCGGNHDLIAQTNPPVLRGLNWTYLEDELIEYGGLKIWGCPHTKEFFNWAFMMTEKGLYEHHAHIPPADIIVTHGPPHGYGDKAPRGHGEFERVGSPALNEYIRRHEPKLVVYGHIHEGSGCWRAGNTIIANVTHVDEHYRPVHSPMVFEI